jgi:alanine dehydrogenase
MAISQEAQAAILDINIDRLADLKAHMGAALTMVFSTKQAVEDYVLEADLVIGAALGIKAVPARQAIG